MNDKEKIEILKEFRLENEKRIDDLFRQNERLEKTILNRHIWILGLVIVILILIGAVSR